jgi:hypothetical protein
MSGNEKMRCAAEWREKETDPTISGVCSDYNFPTSEINVSIQVKLSDSQTRRGKEIGDIEEFHCCEIKKQCPIYAPFKRER